MRVTQRLVFIGDSITEDGRHIDDPYDLGTGYVARVARRRSEAGHADVVINTGIGGHRVVDLEARFDRDCLEHEPDLVSIHVGINDTWRRYDGGEATSVEAFEAAYRSMLTKATDAGARLVLIEPFLLALRPEQSEWRDDLDPKIEVVRALANEFDAQLVAADVAFTRAGWERDPAGLLWDGVHPTDAGRELLARTWCESVTL
ncbi:SGNH/GDSL hydrolase family protein [Herbiconiux sp. SALV-R1]|nr:SGNH/GDSL hydrolase family protein [Herbiconiux sp. SALV-R1]